MASLMENLIEVLNLQCEGYGKLLKLSEEKTSIIVKGDLALLTKITDDEQLAVTEVNHLEAKRAEVMTDIANVLNKDVNTLKLSNLVEMLSTRPEEQKALIDARDRLLQIAADMKKVNERNGELLKNSLEMIEFDLNLMQSMKRAPETANYNKGAYNTGSIMGTGAGKFDAKQ